MQKPHNIQFKNRSEAGKQLARELLQYKPEQPLILALPRGGVPVGFEVAKLLEAPLDTLVARKVGAPFNPEFGVGAIAPGDVIMFDERALNFLGLRKKDLDPVIEQEMREMERRILHYKSGIYTPDTRADTIIIVDDGLATGVTARAAIESVLIQHKPFKVIFAAPICAKETAGLLSDLVDIVCVQSVDNLMAIGYWYEDFPQTTDEEVIYYLDKTYKHYEQSQKTNSNK